MSSIMLLTAFPNMTAESTSCTHSPMPLSTNKALISEYSLKHHSPPSFLCVQWQTHSSSRPLSPLTQSEKARSHLYLQGSHFFFKEEHDQHYGIWKSRSMTAESKSVTSWRLTHSDKEVSTPTARDRNTLWIHSVLLLRPRVQTFPSHLLLLFW